MVRPYPAVDRRRALRRRLRLPRRLQLARDPEVRKTRHRRGRNRHLPRPRRGPGPRLERRQRRHHLRVGPRRDLPGRLRPDLPDRRRPLGVVRRLGRPHRRLRPRRPLAVPMDVLDCPRRPGAPPLLDTGPGGRRLLRPDRPLAGVPAGRDQRRGARPPRVRLADPRADLACLPLDALGLGRGDTRRADTGDRRIRTHPRRRTRGISDARPSTSASSPSSSAASAPSP